jgi:hypothetical protein
MKLILPLFALAFSIFAFAISRHNNSATQETYLITYTISVENSVRVGDTVLVFSRKLDQLCVAEARINILTNTIGATRVVFTSFTKLAR